MVAVLFIACLALTHIYVLSKDINHSSRARNILSEEITKSGIELTSEDTGSHISGKRIEANRLLARKRDEKTKVASKVTFKTIETGARSGIAKGKEKLVKSKFVWKKLWEKHCGGILACNGRNAPYINFKRHSIIAIVSGGVTGEYQLKVTGITKEKRLVVAFEERGLPSASISEAITHPYHFVKIPIIRNKKPKFVKTVVIMTAPSMGPTEKPSIAPTGKSSMAPTEKSSMAPTGKPSMAPTEKPSMAPTGKSSMVPTGKPSTAPIEKPSMAPTGKSSMGPTEKSSMAPTETPSMAPTEKSSMTPIAKSSMAPTGKSSMAPTKKKEASDQALTTMVPTGKPSMTTTVEPTVAQEIFVFRPPIPAPEMGAIDNAPPKMATTSSTTNVHYSSTKEGTNNTKSGH